MQTPFRLHLERSSLQNNEKIITKLLVNLIIWNVELLLLSFDILDYLARVCKVTEDTGPFVNAVLSFPSVASLTLISAVWEAWARAFFQTPSKFIETAAAATLVESDAFLQ